MSGTKPILNVYPKKTSNWMGWLGTVILVLAILCVVYGLCTLPPPGATTTPSPWKTLILAAWIVLPPGWFSIEFFLVYKKYGEPEAFESFKYGQDVAAKFWIAVSTLLSALYVGPDVIQKLASHLKP